MDKGPWRIFYDREKKLVGVISDDFIHDVVLQVTGDFEDETRRAEYCAWLLTVLNRPAVTQSEAPK